VGDARCNQEFNFSEPKDLEKKKKKRKRKKTAGQTKNGYRGEVMGCFMLPKQIACIPEQ